MKSMDLWIPHTTESSKYLSLFGVEPWRRFRTCPVRRACSLYPGSPFKVPAGQSTWSSSGRGHGAKTADALPQYVYGMRACVARSARAVRESLASVARYPAVHIFGIDKRFFSSWAGPCFRCPVKGLFVPNGPLPCRLGPWSKREVDVLGSVFWRGHASTHLLHTLVSTKVTLARTHGVLYLGTRQGT